MTDDKTAAVLREFNLDGMDAVYGIERLQKLAAALAEAREDTKRFREATEKYVAWLGSEDRGANYEGMTRDTHPNGEAIWSEWFHGNLRMCEEAERIGRAALDHARAGGGE